jgi:predicted GIY-YIG superfamily endonuclease
MPFHVYILKSSFTLKFYCGQTDNPEMRLKRHNDAEVTSTKHGVPWQLVGYISLES